MSQHRTEPAGAEVYGTEPAYGTGGPAVEVGSRVEDRGTGDQVKDQVREKAQVAQDKARGALGQARGRLSDQVDQRSTQAGERIAGTAGDVRSIAQELRSQGKDTPANLAEQVADQADRVGDYLRDASGDRILRDVEDFARRQPVLVAAGAFALGLVASRFLKASSSRRYESAYGTSGDGNHRQAFTSPYDTRTSYRTYDPDLVQGEPLGEAYDPRRS